MHSSMGKGDVLACSWCSRWTRSTLLVFTVLLLLHQPLTLAHDGVQKEPAAGVEVADLRSSLRTATTQEAKELSAGAGEGDGPGARLRHLKVKPAAKAHSAVNIQLPGTFKAGAVANARIDLSNFVKDKATDVLVGGSKGSCAVYTFDVDRAGKWPIAYSLETKDAAQERQVVLGFTRGRVAYNSAISWDGRADISNFQTIRAGTKGTMTVRGIDMVMAAGVGQEYTLCLENAVSIIVESICIGHTCIHPGIIDAQPSTQPPPPKPLDPLLASVTKLNVADSCTQSDVPIGVKPGGCMQVVCLPKAIAVGTMFHATVRWCVQRPRAWQVYFGLVDESTGHFVTTSDFHYDIIEDAQCGEHTFDLTINAAKVTKDTNLLWKGLLTPVHYGLAKELDGTIPNLLDGIVPRVLPNGPALDMVDGYRARLINPGALDLVNSPAAMALQAELIDMQTITPIGNTAVTTNMRAGAAAAQAQRQLDDPPQTTQTEVAVAATGDVNAPPAQQPAAEPSQQQQQVVLPTVIEDAHALLLEAGGPLLSLMEAGLLTTLTNGFVPNVLAMTGPLKLPNILDQDGVETQGDCEVVEDHFWNLPQDLSKTVDAIDFNVIPACIKPGEPWSIQVETHLESFALADLRNVLVGGEKNTYLGEATIAAVRKNDGSRWSSNHVVFDATVTSQLRTGDFLYMHSFFVPVGAILQEVWDILEGDFNLQIAVCN